jgi:flagellar basal-body rod protein FlgB
MIDSIPSVTTTMVRVALDGLALQQRVIANNIANVNSPDYVAQQMAFETQLREAAALGIGDDAAAAKERLQRVGADINAGDFIRQAEQAGVQLDIEMARLNQTVLKYQALIQGLNQFGGLTALALSERGR